MTLGWGWSAEVRIETKSGDGEEGTPSRSRPLCHSPPPVLLGTGEWCAQEGGAPAVTPASLGMGQQEADRRGQGMEDSAEQKLLVPPPVAEGGLPYLLRGLAGALGHLGGALSPEGLWRAPAASGVARWAPTWPGSGALQTAVRAPESWACGLDPLPPSVPDLVWDSRKETFSIFFFPFLPNFGDNHAPNDVTAFLGEGHVAP